MRSTVWPHEKFLVRGRRPSLPAGLRVYAIGDIHGRLDLLNQLLALIDADAQLLDGDAVTVAQRGRFLPAMLVRPPLWPPRVEE